MKLVVKSGVQQLGWFKDKKFPYYEAYIRGDENLASLLQTEMKLISIHMPHTVDTESGKKIINFCDSGEVGEASFAKLEELLDFAWNHQVPYLVIHLGFYNSLREDRFTVLERTARRFQEYNDRGVTLCLENVPCWTNICFENEPVISDAEHFLYFKRYCPSIGLTFDVDHLAITTVFQQFYAGFKTGYLASGDRKAFRREMEWKMMQATRKDPDFFCDVVKKKIAAFLLQVQPDTVHAVGSDFCQYQDGEKLPLVGEALPLGFKGTIDGHAVEDRLDHRQWVRSLKNDPYITVELMMRKEYGYLEEIQKSRRLLESIIR
ncbi:MAG TPA: TIM barrel protein [Candidatus Paceibacterota bacterium]